MNKSNLNEIIQNNYVYYKYSIEEKFESGIVLFGWEVKSIRLKLISIEKSYISFINQEIYIYNSIIQPQTKINDFTYNPNRVRKLLLNKKELFFLKNQIHHYGYTIMILNLFWKNSWIKANIGLAKGKKKYDKRYKIYNNIWQRERKIFSNYY